MLTAPVLIIDQPASIADDNLLMQDFQLLLATDIERGTQLALEQHPMLLLLGPQFALPGAQHLRQAGVDIPFVLLVDELPQTIPLQALRLGIRDYLLTPLTPSDLLETVQRIAIQTQQKEQFLRRRLQQIEQQCKQLYRQLHTLYGIGRLITTVPDLAQLWPQLLEAAIYITTAEAGMLCLRPHAEAPLQVTATYGFDARLAADLCADEVTQRLLQEEQVIMVADPQTTLAMPLRAADQLIGLVRLTKQQTDTPFSHQDMQLLTILADYATTAFENVQLRKQIQHGEQNLAFILNESEAAMLIVAPPHNQNVAESENDPQVSFINQAFVNMFALPDPPPTCLPDLVPDTRFLDFVVTTTNHSQHNRLTLQTGRVFDVTVSPLAGGEKLVRLAEKVKRRAACAWETEFLLHVTEHLRLSLTVMQTAGQTLLHEPVPATELLVQLRREMGHLAQLHKELATYDRLTALSFAERALVDLNQLLLQIVGSLQDVAEQNQQQLIYHSPGQPFFVIGDRTWLQQALQGLLEQGVYTAAHGGRVSVTVRLHPHQLLLKVEHRARPTNAEGPGASLQTGRAGFNFDLALCHLIIEKHQGQVWEQSHSESRPMLVVTLPLAYPMLETQQPPETRIA